MLDTAAQLVDELGPEAVTTASIAAAAGVSIGWLYDFFPNRESVFDAVVERSFEKVTPIAEAVHALDARTPTGARRSSGRVDAVRLLSRRARFPRAVVLALPERGDGRPQSPDSIWPASARTYERMHRHGLDSSASTPSTPCTS